MHANITTENETEMDQAQTTDLDRGRNAGNGDSGHVMNRFYRATLTERVVGFMERYDWSLYA
jgi:hypothetical protein